MKVLIINGPNLNLLGKRETGIYGSVTFEEYLEKLKNKYPDTEIDYYQSNIEGELINCLHSADSKYDNIIFNPGGYTHTSVAIADAISSISTPVIEVHISNLFQREEIRHQSLTGKNCKGVLTGFGLDCYEIALKYNLGL